MPARRSTRTRTRGVVHTRGLTKDFGIVRAVDGLDLDVERGEVFGYLGPNGAGKTTTIRLLLDFVRPSKGTALVLGAPVGDPDVRRRIGYLPAELRIEAQYTARDVIDFYGRLRGGVDRSYAAELLARFDLDPTRRYGELSTGNRRKIGIVQAFMHRPELLLLDEPTSGLDPLLQFEFHLLVREVVGAGATVFLSSHVLHEVEQLAGRVGILRKGKLVTVAGVQELRSRARQRIDLHVHGKADPAPFKRLRNVVEASAHDHMISVVVKGSVDGVIKAASRMHVDRIVSHEADLEDVFLELYRADP
jgi:ABC-2 type transport system ATP-binding protein